MGAERAAEMRNALLAKEAELNKMHEFLQGQDEDLRICLARVGTLESCIVADDRYSAHPYTINSTGLETPPATRRWTEHLCETGNCHDGSVLMDDPSRSATAVTQKTATGPPQPRPAPAPPSIPPSRPVVLSSHLSHATPAKNPGLLPNERTAATPSGETCRYTNNSSRRATVECTGERLCLAEQRAEAAEEGRLAAETTAALAQNEARLAQDEARRLRLEAQEMLRWREAVRQVREMLEVSERKGRPRSAGGDGSTDHRCTEERIADPVVQHAQGVSSPALGHLPPRLQRSARDLQADLAAVSERIHVSDNRHERQPASLTSSIPTDSGRSGARNGCGCYTCPLAATDVQEVGRDVNVQKLVRQERSCCPCCWRDGVPREADIDCDDEGAEAEAGRETTEQQVKSADAGTDAQPDCKALISLRNECETLRIVVQALREKDEESQAKITMLQEQVFQRSLEAVKRDALVSSLRKQQMQQQPQSPRRDRATGFKCFSLEREGVSTPNPPQTAGQRSPTSHRTPEREFSARRRQGRRRSHLVTEASSPPVECKHTASTGTPAKRAILTLQSSRCQPSKNCTPSGRTVPISMCDRRIETATEGGTTRSFPDTSADQSFGSGDATPSREIEGSGEGERALRARTPTTDILRRLLYESTPIPEESGDKGGENLALRHARNLGSSNCKSGSPSRRRLFGGEGDVGPSKGFGDRELEHRPSLGPKVLFAALETGRHSNDEREAGGKDVSSGSENHRAEFLNDAWYQKATTGRAAKAQGELGDPAAGIATSTSRIGGSTTRDDNSHHGICHGSLATGEVLKERLLQARKDFSALRSGIQTDEL